MNKSLIGQKLNLNESSSENSQVFWNYSYYPYPDFIGPIDYLAASY